MAKSRPAAAVELNGIAGELLSLVSQFDQYVMRGAGENLQERLQRLEPQGNEVALLKRVETIIAEQGLVEFRSTVSMILDRLEDNRFEIAVFGRVSSGKSSLLNATLGNGCVAGRCDSHYRRSYPHHLRRDFSRECVVRQPVA